MRQHNPIYLNHLGNAYSYLGKYQQAISYFEQALEIYKKIYGENHPEVAGSINNLGAAYADLEEYQQAISYYERALEIYQEVLPANHPTIKMVEKNIKRLADKRR